MYNKKEIFENAWVRAGNAAIIHGGKKSEYFAECLKEEWAFVKGLVEGAKKVKEERKNRPERVQVSNVEVIGMKDWFIRKNFDQNEAYAIRNEADEFKIVEETAKAYRFKISTPYGTITTWAPKSVCIVA